MRKIFIAENVDDVFKTASGSWQEETLEVRWLLNDNAEDPSVYSHERDEDGNVAGENVPCDSILCPVELEKMDESAGHPIWRLPDETLVRLRRLHEDALEQSAEERLAHEARQLQQLEMEREARRGAHSNCRAQQQQLGPPPLRVSIPAGGACAKARSWLEHSPVGALA